MDMIYWDHYYNLVLALNFCIVIGLFASLRYFSGVISHVSATDELLRKDNPAFGVSLAAAVFSITIMLSGTMYGTPEGTLMETVVAVGLFGVLGIFLMALTRIIFDEITLPKVALRDEITRGNMAAAFADAGNMIASAIIIRGIMIWVPATTFEGMLVVLGGFAISQILLTLMTLMKIKMFPKFFPGYDFEKEVDAGNTALALRFAGMKIGTAFAIMTAAQVVVYEEADMVRILSAWAIASVVAVVIWKFLCFVSERLILFKVNIKQEILEQKNSALGLLQGVIYIALGMLISSL